MNDVIVGDFWHVLEAEARGRRLIRPSTALQTSDLGGVYWVVRDAFADQSQVDDVVAHLQDAIGARVRVTSVRVLAKLATLLDGAAAENGKVGGFDWSRFYPSTFLPPGSQCDGSGWVQRGDRAWKSKLDEYVSAPDSFGAAPSCLVLWGRSGCGKTLALNDLEAVSGSEAVCRRRVMRFSCADTEWSGHSDKKEAKACDEATDAEVWRERLARLLDREARERLLLCVDDFDVLQPVEKRMLIDALCELRCPRILVCDDFYARENSWLFGRDERKFRQLKANGVHAHALAAHLAVAFPNLGATLAQRVSAHIYQYNAVTLVDSEILGAQLAAQMATEPRDSFATSAEFAAHLATAFPDLTQKMAMHIAMESRGDVRAAVLSAYVGGETRDFCERQALNYSLLECVRAIDPRAECEARFDARSDAETLGELLHANAPRIVDGDVRVRRPVMAALADALDSLSIAALYDDERRETGYAGRDGLDTDKAIHFDLAVATPAAWLGRVVETEALEHKLAFEFPSSRIFFAASGEAPHYARVAHHLEAFGRMAAGLTFEQAAEYRACLDDEKLFSAKTHTRQQQSNAALRVDQYAAVLFGELHDSGADLHDLLRVRGKSDPRLLEVAQRCAAAGLEQADFVFLCRHEMRALPAADTQLADSTIEAHFKHSGAKVARRPPDAAAKERAISKTELAAVVAEATAPKKAPPPPTTPKKRATAPKAAPTTPKKRAKAPPPPPPKNQPTIDMAFFKCKSKR